MSSKSCRKDAGGRNESWNPLLRSYPDSRKINSLTFEAETMYTRLLAQADDFGNYDGDPYLLLTGLFRRSIKSRHMDETLAQKMRDEIVAVGLACLYRDDDGQVYLHLNNCRRRLRNDVTPDKRFPSCGAVLIVAGSLEEDSDTARSESVTDPARTRPAPVTDAARTRNGPGPLDPDPDKTQTRPDADVVAAGAGSDDDLNARASVPADRESVAEQIGNLIQGQAPSVTVGAAEVFQVWNAFAKKPAREADMLRVERAYSGLRLGPPEQSATHAEILAALENYRDACNLPNSQAWPHPLPIFLTWEKIQKFLPSFYNQDNFDASKFGRGAEPAHECYRRGGQGCLNPGVHKHTDDTGADYWVCEMHEQQRRQLSARAREASV